MARVTYGVTPTDGARAVVPVSQGASIQEEYAPIVCEMTALAAPPQRPPQRDPGNPHPFREPCRHASKASDMREMIDTTSPHPWEVGCRPLPSAIGRGGGISTLSDSRT